MRRLLRVSSCLLLVSFAVGAAGVGAAASFSPTYRPDPNLLPQGWQHLADRGSVSTQPGDPLSSGTLSSGPLPLSLGTQRSWVDLNTANTRRLGLVHRVIDRLADEVAWLHVQEAGAGVNEADLKPLRDQLARERDAAGAMWNLTGLDEIRLELVTVARASAMVRVTELRTLIDDSLRLGVAPADLVAPAGAADAATEAMTRAGTTEELWRVVEGLGVHVADVTKRKQDREAELAAKAAAEQRARDYYNSLEGLRQRGYDALRAGRNEAAWIAFLGRGALGDAYVQLEGAAAALEAVDRPQLAAAVENEQRLAGLVHQVFVTRLPHKVILVSLGEQRLWAYENGGVVIDTLVTTGRPELPTDVGLMRVYRKNLNWLMRSPWGPGSPYWYPDLTVRYAMWFHPSGEAIHDSWWRGWYGPGSNLGGYGSHGCIGLPNGPIDTLYSWAPVNTPVVVIPGDGSLPGYQMSRRTYNDPAMGG